MGWKGTLLFSGSFLLVSLTVLLMTFGVIEPTEGRPPPRWIGTIVGALFGLGGLGPLSEGVLRKAAPWVASVFWTSFGLVLLGGLLSVLHWALIETAREGFGHGIGAAIFSSFGLAIGGFAALVFDLYFLYAMYYVIRMAFARRGNRDGPERPAA